MSTPATERSPSSTRRSWLGTGLLILVLPIAVCLMLLAFLTPALNSGPEDLPLAVAGPAPAVEQITDALEERSPGAFEITEYDDAEQAEQAVADREAIGAVTVGQQGVEILKASGAGTPYGTMMDGIATGLEEQQKAQAQQAPAQGDQTAAQSEQTQGQQAPSDQPQQAPAQEVTVRDVAPLTDDDPNATAMSTLALPLAFGGMISAAAFTMLSGNRPAVRALGIIGFSALAGVAVTWVLQSWLHAVDGDFWALAGVLALGIAAISLAVSGLQSVLGGAGLALGAVLMMFVANPLSGMATGWQWLPQPWGAIGQQLPIGAAGTALRSVAFFDGTGMTHALIVLVCWAAAGLLLIALSALRKHRKNRTRRADPSASTRSA